MLSHRNKRLIIIGLILMSSQAVSAQIEEYIENYVADKAEDYINNISGGLYSKAKELYYNPIGTIWESYIQSDVQRSVNQKVGELKNFKVNETELSRLRDKYGIGENMPTDQKTMFMPVRYGISESFSKSLIKTNINISELTNKEILVSFIDSLKASSRYNNLEEVLNKNVLDSIELLMDIAAKDTLLKDINDCRGLSGLFNRHPEIIRVYLNSECKALRTNTSHLFYWGVLADSHKNRLPRKAQLINPRYIKFIKKTEKDVNLVYEGSIIGEYSSDGKLCECISPELLNLMPKPFCIYVYNKTYLVIDNIGRLLSARLIINTQENTIKNTKVKFKDLGKSLNISGNNDLYSQLLKKLKVQPSTAYLVETGNLHNTTEMSRLKKYLKELSKNNSNPTVDIVLSYDSSSKCASEIKIEEVDKSGIDSIKTIDYTDYCLGYKEEKQNRFLRNIRVYKKVFYGSIDGRYPIIMNFCLFRKGKTGEISGDYFYPKLGSSDRMTLKGTYNDNAVTFSEYDSAGKKYGEFRGNLSGNIMSGKFIKNGKEKSFFLFYKQ